MSLETKDWVGTELAAGRYQVVSELGAGGMAFVYLALDRADNRKVVVKVPRQAMLEDLEFTGRFVREGKSLVRLVHPHIVKIFDAGEHHGRPFLVMEFLPGGNLRDRLKHGNTSVADLQTWLPGIASALDFCHANDCVHRDVKPDNILFDAQGKAYLSDFGIAKVMSKSPKTKMTVLTSAGMVLGTAQYMAPELVMGKKYDGKADQYGLAVTVYECLAGRTPFSGNTPMAVIVEQSTKDAPLLKSLNPAVPAKLADTVHRALAKDPGARFADCMSFARALPTATGNAGQIAPTVIESREIPKVTCQGCQKQFNVPPTAIGKKIRCPACKTAIAGPPALPPGKGPPNSETNRERVVNSETVFSPARRPSGRPEGDDEPDAGLESEYEDETARGNSSTLIALALGLALVICVCIGLWAYLPPPRSSAPNDDAMARLAEEEKQTRLELERKLAELQAKEATERTPKDAIPPKKKTDPIVSAPAQAEPPSALDCTGPTGASAERVKAAQKEWADYLKVPVRKSVDLGKGVTMELVLVPPGRFMMGSPVGEEGRFSEDFEFQHKVEITTAFYMGVYAVTQAEYKAVMGTNPSAFSSEGFHKNKVVKIDTRTFPVEKVSWEEAKQFCGKLAAPDGKLFRLPSEAQWEYACRAGTRTPFYFGQTINTDQANFGNSRGRPMPVGSFAPNGLGLHDMHGNIWQWCEDWFGAGYYKTSQGADPLNSTAGEVRVLRGGSWLVGSGGCRAAYRGSLAPGDRVSYIGFRLVLCSR